MANSRNSNKTNKYKIAVLKGGVVIAIEVHKETKETMTGRTFAVGRNASDTGYTFAPVRFFHTPTIMKCNMLFIEDMPEEMARAYEQFLSTIP